MQPPFQARTHALRMRPIHLMHRYLSLATEFLHAGSGAVNVRCSSKKQRRGSKHDNYSCRSDEVSVRRGICSGEYRLSWHTVNLWRCCSDATASVNRAGPRMGIIAARQLRGAIRLIGGGTARIEDGVGLIIHLGCG